MLSRRRYLQRFGLAVGGLCLAPGIAWSLPDQTSVPVRVRLGLNENPFGPSPRALDAIQRELGRVARYNDDERTQELIDVIAAKERVRPEQVVLGEILEPLGLYLSAQGGAGGKFIYATPGYTALIEAAATLGGRGVAVPLDAKLQNDLPALAASVDPSTRAVFIVNPHNPTGTVSDTAALKQFLRAASQRTLLIVDEAYLEFSDDFAARTAVDLVRDGANVVVFRTFAKAYGLAGLDVGYGLFPVELAKSLRARGVGAPRSLNRLAVVAATASLRDADYVDAVRRKVAAERDAWYVELRKWGLRFTESQGNFIFFEAKRPQASIAKSLLQRGVDIGRAFPPYETWARISIGLPAENAVARSALAEVLR